MMTLNNDDTLEQSIRWLQYMLNELALSNAALPRLVVTGRFDEPTLEAVMTFQRDFFPPVTGVVDQATWDAIVDAYQQNQLFNGAPALLRVLPSSRFFTKEGQSSEQLLLAQAMLSSLSRAVTNFAGCAMDGNNSGETLADLQMVQALSGLPVTGTLDRATWEFLARLYHMFVTRSGQSSAT
jgi:peptidoglycan hydrolase-like protein with peptidoglycan-binding domain